MLQAFIILITNFVFLQTMISDLYFIKKFLLSKAQRWEFKNGSLVIKSDMR